MAKPLSIRSFPGARRVALLAALLACTAACKSSSPSATEPVAPVPYEERFLSARPPVGPAWVVDTAGLDTGRRILLASLQGLVNRSRARLYVLARDTDGFWIDRYAARGLVEVAGSSDLDGVLDRFAGEASGYVLVAAAEPWTLNAGVTIAAVHGALVATERDQAGLEARGLRLIEDLRGRWADELAAYESTVDEYGSRLRYPGVAILRPTDLLHDFAYQQGMAVLFGRPKRPGWDRMLSLVRRFPGGRAVYGYASDDGLEESIAVFQLSTRGHLLVPSDTTSNLSFHVAVGAGRPRVRVPDAAVDGVAPCTTDRVNAVVAISDGDNVVLPTGIYAGARQWPSPARGRLPLGWSISPSLPILAPAVWDHYALTVSAADELVPVIGYAYAAANQLPDPDEFYRISFAMARDLNLASFWSFAAGVDLGNTDQLRRIDLAAGDGPPWGLLAGYSDSRLDFGSTPQGRPVLGAARSSYTDTPAEIAAKIRQLAALPPAQRLPAYFFSAAVWTNDAAMLVEQLAPLADEEGVRFLTPSQAAACLAASAGAADSSR